MRTPTYDLAAVLMFTVDSVIVLLAQLASREGPKGVEHKQLSVARPPLRRALLRRRGAPVVRPHARPPRPPPPPRGLVRIAVVIVGVVALVVLLGLASSLRRPRFMFAAFSPRPAKRRPRHPSALSDRRSPAQSPSPSGLRLGLVVGIVLGRLVVVVVALLVLPLLSLPASCGTRAVLQSSSCRPCADFVSSSRRLASPRLVVASPRLCQTRPRVCLPSRPSSRSRACPRPRPPAPPPCRPSCRRRRRLRPRSRRSQPHAMPTVSVVSVACATTQTRGGMLSSPLQWVREADTMTRWGSEGRTMTRG